MNTLELFSGTASFSKVAKALGHNTFTVELDDSFKPDYCVDVMNIDYSRLPSDIDFVWASPPCESFSVASIGKHWNIDNTPKTAQAEASVRLIEKTIEIIETIKPKYFIIENPRGKLRKLPMMQQFNRYTVSYCQYGDTRMKPTDLWSNMPLLELRQVCKNGMSCHVSAPRGSRTGTQGIKTYAERSVVPADLCKDILRQLK